MTPSRSDIEADFIGRTIAARKLQFETQQEIAAVLGLTQPTYAKYEKRSPLPFYLMERFCQICQVRAEWLITGKGPGPAWQRVDKRPKSHRQPKPVRRRSVHRKIA
jgi:transcriptional regulator with XRE-family HTH domain